MTAAWCRVRVLGSGQDARSWSLGGTGLKAAEPNSFDVIVAGLGAMGSAALDQVAGRGARVLGIDQYQVPHGHGSSGGDTRLIRKAYFEHPDYVPLLERAYANWQALEDASGERLLYRTGTLYLGHPDAELIDGSTRSAREHGLALETLDAAAVRTRFPRFHCPDGYRALFEPDAGFLLCERAIAAQIRRASARGACIASGQRVTGWRPDGDGLLVMTDQGRYRAGALVLSVGSWSGPLLAGLGVELSVTRQLLFWVPDPGAGFALGETPCWAVQRPDAAGLFYGFPVLPNGLGMRSGIKVAQHAPGEPADPDGPRRPPEAAEFDAVRAALAPFVTGLGETMTASHVCLYTNSRDGHFVIDTHPDDARVVFGCGFSGHGFKFASVVGEALADLALEGASALPIGFLRRR